MISNCVLGIHLKETKMYFHTETCTQIFVAVVFVFIVQTRNYSDVLQRVNG